MTQARVLSGVLTLARLFYSSSDYVGVVVTTVIAQAAAVEPALDSDGCELRQNSSTDVRKFRYFHKSTQGCQKSMDSEKQEDPSNRRNGNSWDASNNST